jgi:Tol biopolymer transport system component
MSRWRISVGATILAVLCALSACSGSDPGTDESPSPTAASTSSDATPAVAGLTPKCEDGEPPAWVIEASHEGDDAPDPAGRIYFGQIARDAEALGQIVRPLYAVDPDGSDVEMILDCQIQRPRVSPDGTRLLFSIVMEDASGVETWQIATMALDGSDLRILTSGEGYSETPDWSPDGSWIIYSGTREPCPPAGGYDCEGVLWSLMRMDADGGHHELIGEPDQVDWEPRLSPDGRSVVFTRFDDVKGRLVVRDLTSGRERSVEHPELTLEHPDWSPDGRWITYNTVGEPGCTSCESVERVPADDLRTEPEVLYAAGEGRAGIKPAYAPDGSQITFGCTSELCVMGPDGEDPTVIVEVPDVELNHFAWGGPVP